MLCISDGHKLTRGVGASTRGSPDQPRWNSSRERVRRPMEGSAAKPWTDKLWVYDLRTNQHFTLKQKPIQRSDFDEFVECYKAGARHKRKSTWSEDNPDGRWRCYIY